MAAENMAAENLRTKQKQKTLPTWPGKAFEWFAGYESSSFRVRRADFTPFPLMFCKQAEKTVISL
jgi:hypothetical protein